jgi:hypothetical protein
MNDVLTRSGAGSCSPKRFIIAGLQLLDLGCVSNPWVFDVEEISLTVKTERILTWKRRNLPVYGRAHSADMLPPGLRQRIFGESVAMAEEAIIVNNHTGPGILHPESLQS